MKKVLIFLADGFEQIEAMTVIDILRRGAVDVTTVSISETKTVKSSHDVEITADDLFCNVKNNDYDMLILPGGGLGVQNLKKSKELLDILNTYNNQNKYLAAICAAPTILGMLDILKNRHSVCYKGLESELIGAIITNNNVEVDSNIITSKSASTSLEFSFRILEILTSTDICDKVKNDILYV